MVTVTYGVYLVDVVDKLKAVINGTASFSGKVHADVMDEVDYNPNARIELTRDSFDDVGPQVTEHLTELTVKVRYMAGVAESDQDTLMGYVGEIVDAIEANRTLSSSYITDTEITGTEFSVQDRGGGLITRHCHISVVVQGLRN